VLIGEVSVLQWLQRPLSPTLFPYTTLFRSGSASAVEGNYPAGGDPQGHLRGGQDERCRPGQHGQPAAHARDRPAQGGSRLAGTRSEEHTSELQSRENLVCRLLLEKKTHHQR